MLYLFMDPFYPYYCQFGITASFLYEAVIAIEMRYTTTLLKAGWDLTSKYDRLRYFSYHILILGFCISCAVVASAQGDIDSDDVTNSNQRGVSV